MIIRFKPKDQTEAKRMEGTLSMLRGVLFAVWLISAYAVVKNIQTNLDTFSERYGFDVFTGAMFYLSLVLPICVLVAEALISIVHIAKSPQGSALVLFSGPLSKWYANASYCGVAITLLIIEGANIALANHGGELWDLFGKPAAYIVILIGILCFDMLACLAVAFMLTFTESGISATIRAVYVDDD